MIRDKPQSLILVIKLKIKSVWKAGRGQYCQSLNVEFSKMENG